MKYESEAQGEVRTFVYAWQAARYALRCSGREERGAFYGWMGAIVWGVFAVEAYVNHIGPGVVKGWRKEDRRPLRNKIEDVAAALKVNLQPDGDPLRTILDAVGFRNSIAHGRTAKVAFSAQVDDPDHDPFSRLPPTEWQAFCTQEKAATVLDQVERLIKEFHLAAGHDEDPFLSAGRATGSVSPAVRKDST